MRCVCGKKIGPDPRNFNQRVSLGRNDLLIRTFLKCQYLTARGVSTALYVHSDSGVIGVSSCPLLRKSTTVVDNG
ncbi:YobH family protein [Klebsiella pneumoniae]